MGSFCRLAPRIEGKANLPPPTSAEPRSPFNLASFSQPPATHSRRVRRALSRDAPRPPSRCAPARQMAQHSGMDVQDSARIRILSTMTFQKRRCAPTTLMAHRRFDPHFGHRERSFELPSPGRSPTRRRLCSPYETDRPRAAPDAGHRSRGIVVPTTSVSRR